MPYHTISIVSMGILDMVAGTLHQFLSIDLQLNVHEPQKRLISTFELILRIESENEHLNFLIRESVYPNYCINAHKIRKKLCTLREGWYHHRPPSLLLIALRIK
uniref:Uncharacterized protein n=1 Tax=Glossina palpalis gambiensis TaxID=67801 RepID=A0A1B0BBG1_9MUSC